MKKFKSILVLSLLVVLLGSCQLKSPFNKSNDKLRAVATEYSIPSNQEFVIGDFQDVHYNAIIDNKSETSVEVIVIDEKTNLTTRRFILETNHEAFISAAKYERVIIQNSSDKEIKLGLGFNKEIEGMRYQNVKEYK